MTVRSLGICLTFIALLTKVTVAQQNQQNPAANSNNGQQSPLDLANLLGNLQNNNNQPNNNNNQQPPPQANNVPFPNLPSNGQPGSNNNGQVPKIDLPDNIPFGIVLPGFPSGPGRWSAWAGTSSQQYQQNSGYYPGYYSNQYYNQYPYNSYYNQYPYNSYQIQQPTYSQQSYVVPSQTYVLPSYTQQQYVVQPSSYPVYTQPTYQQATNTKYVLVPNQQNTVNLPNTIPFGIVLPGFPGGPGAYSSMLSGKRK